jgi:predicted dehydrogenase
MTLTKIKLAIIGAGNIVTNRHLPYLRHQSEFSVEAIVGTTLTKAQRLAHQYHIPHCGYFGADQHITGYQWFSQIDAVLIATPPHTHAALIKECLQAGKHVFTEKPFVTDIKMGKILVKLARQKRLILAVNHNFQFASSFQKLNQLMVGGSLGQPKSFLLQQFSNKDRRLPKWGNELPGGLFYDESPHFFYLLRRFAGANIKFLHSTIYRSQIVANTPWILTADLKSGHIPISIYCNFEAAICEWYFIVCGTKKTAIVDFFRDIIIVLPHDGIHLGKQVLTTSAVATFSHWFGTVSNGLAYLTHRLYYGFDHTYHNFYMAITHHRSSYLDNMSGQDGLVINQLQLQVINDALIN